MKKILFGFVLILIMSNMAIVFAQPQTDPTADLLDMNGRPTVGEPYLDITQSEVERTASDYVATIKLAGTVPSQTSSSGLFIEWDIMIDVDESSTTGAWLGETNAAWRQRMVNGIGVDLMVRLAMNSTMRWAEVYVVTDLTWWNVAFPKVSASEVELTVPVSIYQEHLKTPETFDFTVLVRKYGVGGAAHALPAGNALQAFDKAPNSDYYAFRAGAVTLIPEFPATQVVAAIVFSLAALTLNLRRTRKSARNHKI